MRCSAALLVFLVSIGAATPAVAETYLLKSGARIYGVAEKHPRGEPSEEWMTVRTSYGRVSFKKADLKRKLTRGEERTTLYIEEARVTSVEGEVFKSADGGESWIRIPWKVEAKETVAPAEFPPRVRAGELVRTGPKSAVDLDVGWGVVRLDEESVLGLQMFEGATLRLDKGKMGARLEELPKGRRFRVETPEASMAVEGTVFIVQRGTYTRLVVLEGVVAAGETRVGAGEAVEISADGVRDRGPPTTSEREFRSDLERAISLPCVGWARIPRGVHVTPKVPRLPPGRSIGPVRIEPFLLGRYEITRAQYGVFLRWLSIHGDADLWPGGRPGGVRYRCSPEVPLSGWEGPDWEPGAVCVDGVRWRAAFAFCRWLGGRLPSEAEWEYAGCAQVEGGPPFPSNMRGSVREYGWLANNSGKKEYAGIPVPQSDWTVAAEFLRQNECRLHPVGRKLPSPFGLYDMVGNASEWVADAVPPEEGGGELHVARGGDYGLGNQVWNSWLRRARGICEIKTDERIGIRVARDLPR